MLVAHGHERLGGVGGIGAERGLVRAGGPGDAAGDPADPPGAAVVVAEQAVGAVGGAVAIARVAVGRTPVGRAAVARAAEHGVVRGNDEPPGRQPDPVPRPGRVPAPVLPLRLGGDLPVLAHLELGGQAREVHAAALLGRDGAGEDVPLGRRGGVRGGQQDDVPIGRFDRDGVAAGAALAARDHDGGAEGAAPVEGDRGDHVDLPGVPGALVARLREHHEPAVPAAQQRGDPHGGDTEARGLQHGPTRRGEQGRGRGRWRRRPRGGHGTYYLKARIAEQEGLARRGRDCLPGPR